MAALVYATGLASSSPSFGGIGWVNFGTFSIAPGATSSRSETFKDGSTVTFTLTNTTVSGAGFTFTARATPVWTGAAFGNTGYTGIVGNTAFVIGGTNVNNTLGVSNILVKDRFGVTIPNYYVIAANSEASGSGEGAVQRYVTNGTVWSQLANLPPVGGGSGTTPTISGVGTNTVTLTGATDPGYTGPVFVTKNPSQITLNVRGVGINESVSFGFAIDTVILNKVINNRYFSADQFDLSVVGVQSAFTTTFGNTYGTQPIVAQVFGQNGESYVLNEVMSAGSLATLSQYNKKIQYTNLSAGGTTVPTTTTIPGNISLALGDVILATITNSIMPVTITSSKTVSQSFAAKSDTLTYTVVLNNTGTISANNIVFIDTIPNGTTFVTNSLTQDGVPISGNPSPPSGVNIGSMQSNTTTTLTFQVTINNTIPNPNPIRNTATGNFTYAILPTTGVSGYNTNTTSTKVNSSILTSSKIVSKTFANLGDILTYTIPISNSGNATASNLIFIDTIPNGTSLVAGSLKQDGIAVSGSPDSPGVTLPNSIGINKTTTITFQVRINTVPNPNPIPNTATATYTFTLDPSVPNGESSSTNTNTVNTTVAFASLSGITKSVDKSFATCGDIITYIIVAPNSGSVTAQNLVFKDTIPNGTILVANSVFVNGVQQTGATPSTGVTIPNIGPGITATISFSVLIQC